jgi:hypothetical protein
VLFFILSPGILTRIPKNGDKYLVTFVHSIIFAALLYFLMRNLPIYEGIEGDHTGLAVLWVLLILVLSAGVLHFILPPNKKQV